MIISTGQFAKQIAKARFGDRIVLCQDADKISSPPVFWAHPKGVVTKKGDSFWLNEADSSRGDSALYSGEYKTSFSCPTGFVILKDDQFLLDGEKPMTPVQAHESFTAPSSIIQIKGRTFLAGGEKDGIELTEGEWDDWATHPFGVMFKWGSRVVLVVTQPPNSKVPQSESKPS